MSLVEDFWRVWARLSPGWEQYLQSIGLNLAGATQNTLLQTLVKPVSIKRGMPGLEEFASNGIRGIEPGDPARSLLYHVLASPHVVPDSVREEFYPTIAELVTLENLIFGLDFPSIDDLRLRAMGAPLSIAVFAYEYAPAVDTVHHRHADLVFSRTAISRVGNAKPNYLPKSRGFLPNGGRGAVHVVPTRFGVFIAALRPGDRQGSGPEEFQPTDKDQQFWIPLHKLFNGPECIDGFDVRLEITARHLNEKIRRVHLALQREGVDTGWSGAQLDESPFSIKSDLAEFDDSQGLLIPVPHRLVEPARTKSGCYVSFPVPPHHARLTETASLQFPAQNDACPSPQFVHVRHALVDGKIVYLQRADKNIMDVVEAGNYQAVNFVDYTGDGSVDARCPALAVEIPTHLPAYSVLAQPDFFPLVKQQDLFDWWQNASPTAIRNNIWPDSDVRPSPLSASRLPANVQLPFAGFDSTDVTITSIVGFHRPAGAAAHILPRRPHRESTLSFRATNFFDPGWDTAKDFSRDAASPKGTFHLANYGLGSPFPEDTVLCAALGAYWPGAVPDNTRAFAPHAYPSVTPLVDRDLGWDGVPPPVAESDRTILSIVPAYIDYVRAIILDSLPYDRFADTTLEGYIKRTLAVARVYQVLGVATREQRGKYLFLSFRPATTRELNDLYKASGAVLEARDAYYLELAPYVSTTAVPHRFDVTKVQIGSRQTFLFDPATVASRQGNGNAWQVSRF